MGKALRVLVGVGCIVASLGLGACAREVADGEEGNNASNNSGDNNDDNNDLPPDIEVTGDPIGTTYGPGFTKKTAGLCSWEFRTEDANGSQIDDGYCTSDAECDRFGEGLSCDPERERCKVPCDRHAECAVPDGFPPLPDSFDIECEPWPEPIGVCFDENRSPCFGGNATCAPGFNCQEGQE